MNRLMALGLTAMLVIACTQAPTTPSAAPTIGATAPTKPPLASIEPGITMPATPVPEARFSVTQLELLTDPADVVPGSNVSVVAEVKNDGTAPGQYVAELTIDGTPAAEREFSLEAGESESKEIAFVVGSAGNYTVAIEDFSLLIDVLGPASFEQGDLLISPNPVVLGEEVEVTVVVSNVGGMTGKHIVGLELDGSTLATETVTVEGGDSRTLSFPFTPATPGPHSISVNGQEAELLVWDLDRPKNGTMLVNRLGGGLGRLTVENGNDRDAFIALVRAANPMKSPLAFYVRAGQSQTVRRIRDGNYRVFYSLGNDWDRYSRRFTADADYGRFSDALPFNTTARTYTTWTLTLHTVVGGNAATDDIGEEEFPGLDE